MARMTILILVLSLVIAPLSAAAPRASEETVNAWETIVSEMFGWLASWLPADSNEQEGGVSIAVGQSCAELGSYIDPSGQPCSAGFPEAGSPTPETTGNEAAQQR